MSELDQIQHLPEILGALDGTPEEVKAKLERLVDEQKLPAEFADELYKEVVNAPPTIKPATQPIEAVPGLIPTKAEPERFSDTPTTRTKRASSSKIPEIKLPRKAIIIGTGLVVTALIGIAVTQTGLMSGADQNQRTPTKTSVPDVKATQRPTTQKSTLTPEPTVAAGNSTKTNSPGIDRIIYPWQADSVKARQCEFALDTKARSAFRVWEKKQCRRIKHPLQ